MCLCFSVELPSCGCCVLLCACCTRRVARQRGWRILDRTGVTARLYGTAMTDVEFESLELFDNGDGLHWHWWVIRELNVRLLDMVATA